jgi:glutathione peroxidase
MSTSLYEIALKTLAGEPTTLETYKGKVILAVNVASKCGLTPQYEALEALYKKYKDKGLVVAGFPANDFAGQEPGTSDEIKTFCTANFGVDFPMFEKIPVVGPQKHPLYAALIAAQPKATSVTGNAWPGVLAQHGLTVNPAPEVLWNFEKFLISRTGEVVARFAPDTKPDAPELAAAIEAELTK